jgi:predicted NAD-dependent protein-ADP-ribosyltransferase YbiA (DUF1768 family)
MKYGVTQKFSKPEFKKMLLDTGNQEIREGNMWNDDFWGVCMKRNKGKNILGKILMDLREELK